MICILVSGMPATGKSTLARALGERLGLPVFSKDAIKERLYDDVGFRSREEKVRLGVAAMNLLYDAAERIMERGQSVILENNFEESSLPGLRALLERTGAEAFTVLLTGDIEAIYRRFAARNESPERHRGHVVNDRYPEEGPGAAARTMPFEDFARGIRDRGMDGFAVGGPRIVVDTTDFARVDVQEIAARIEAYCRGEGDAKEACRAAGGLHGDRFLP